MPTIFDHPGLPSAAPASAPVPSIGPRKIQIP
uniref:Cytochrome b6/f complex subunit VI n=1 Tax=Selaginella bisulcata TaxID=1715365 RepID=A0A482CHJ2_9TRAC|nr:cytochrome b6/f complex subunit VI [Selaginella bisulcata]QBL75992.1 cytochrome b6/f complex subunit VI [Selaginella bisulcata]